MIRWATNHAYLTKNDTDEINVFEARKWIDRFQSETFDLGTRKGNLKNGLTIYSQENVQDMICQLPVRGTLWKTIDWPTHSLLFLPDTRANSSIATYRHTFKIPKTVDRVNASMCISYYRYLLARTLPRTLPEKSQLATWKDYVSHRSHGVLSGCSSLGVLDLKDHWLCLQLYFNG